LNLFGLFLTFSRAALLTFGLGLIVLAIIYIWRKIGSFRSLILPYTAIILFSLLSIAILKNFLITRVTFTDEATKERVFYDQVGLKMIKGHPLIGVGEGTSVLHMKQYSLVPLQPWEIQPVHNYYLLTAAEIGIIGLIIVLMLFAVTLKDLAKQFFLASRMGDDKYSTPQRLFDLTLLTISGCFLILMLFDHYFYTIEQTQLLLWMVLGLLVARTTHK